jgi:predicted phosphoribosyltransferase
VVLAVPVIAARAEVELTQPAGEAADEVVSVAAPFGFAAVGQYYRRFDATEDSEVTALLAEAAERTDVPEEKPETDTV